MAIPPVGPDGVRRTVNYGLSTAQTIWNVRSALNVAALNCLEPEHAEILPAYKSLLERGEKALARTNRNLLAQYRESYGSEGRAAYDRYMTQVYNYFALPPALDEFCDVSQQVARESLLVEPDEIDSFALRSLPVLEAVFEDFFSSYEQYRTAVASWDAEYGPPQPAATLVSGPGAANTGTAATGSIGTASIGTGVASADGTAQAAGGTDAATVQAIPTFDPSPSQVAQPAAPTVPAPGQPGAVQQAAIPPAGEAVQAVSQPVVQGEANVAAQPGFGADLTGTVAEEPAETPTIVLTPGPEGADDDAEDNAGDRANDSAGDTGA